MKISLNWLKSYIDFECDPNSLAHKLTMVGLEVEEIQPIEPPFSNVVVGYVISVKKHPNADKLSVCQVDIGSEKLSVVCGAPNVREGILVPVVKTGGHVGEMNVKEVKIRGVVSRGMICSERELGLSDNHKGILILDKNSQTPGKPFLEEMQKSDTVLQIDVTPNRPDCLSHIGIAREVGTIFGKSLRIPSEHVETTDIPIDSLADVTIQDQDACPRYTVRIVKDVQIAPSPDWLQSRLQSVGIRSINNVVDITNFVLMETGHPLHAFDYDYIEQHKIIVRKAKKGEKFITLDDTERILTVDDLLICDGRRPVALAGIMGGQNSEVSDTTKHILLESAYFDSMTIRKSARRLVMSTEASQRFERGADPNGTLYAINRAASLIAEFANGKVVEGTIDVYPRPIKPLSISLRSSYLKRVLGVEIPDDTVVTILNDLGLECKSIHHPITVSVPTYRPDLQNEIDLVEEVVRHYGFEHIPANTINHIQLTTNRNEAQENTELIRDIFCGLGFAEVWNNTLVSESHVKSLTPNIKPISIQNPLSPETQYLRTSGIASILDNLQWNLNRGERNLRFFEIAQTFQYDTEKCGLEKWMIVGGLTGECFPKPYWKNKSITVDFYHLKGLLGSFLSRLQIPDITFQTTNDHLFEDNSAAIYSKKKKIGIFGEFQKHLIECWSLKQQAYGFQLDFEALTEEIPKITKYKDIPKYPAVKLDLAMIVDECVSSEQMIDAIFKSGGKLVAQVDIFDVYRGKPLKENEKSVAFALTFISKDRTLREDEINPVFDKIIQNLSNKFHASLRS
ncbi:phenylalanine--tRNA ligase subunit beta [bacterium]|nr:phenylalanine--tRNA ligase subunit beta [bacterium]